MNSVLDPNTLGLYPDLEICPHSDPDSSFGFEQVDPLPGYPAQPNNHCIPTTFLILSGGQI